MQYAPVVRIDSPKPLRVILVVHLRTALEVATALGDLHRIPVFHVDLEPYEYPLLIREGQGSDPDCRLRVVV